MRDFGTAVSTLLESFSNGLAVIKRLKRKRKETKTNIDASTKAEEDRLKVSLATNRRDIKSVYDRCAQVGNFTGDAEASHTLSAILFRLNAGFVGIIERFLNGKSTYSDYHVLVNLSNTSKIETLQAFEKLQTRVSQSSLSLIANIQPTPHHGKRRKHRKTSKNTSNASSSEKSKNASGDQLQSTYLGPATSSGWVRTKKNGKKSSSFKGSVTAQVPNPNPNPTKPAIQNSPQLSPQPITQPRPVPQPTPQPQPPLTHKPSLHLSIISFATTSTKIGEIPEYKWNKNYPNIADPRPVFPLQPYVEPEKGRSRLRKIFRRG